MVSTEYLSQFYIKINGSDASETVMDKIISIEVDDNLILPDMFSVHLRDTTFSMTDSSDFDLGSKIEISAQSGSSTVDLLAGEITALEPQFDHDLGPTLVIMGYDEAHRLHRSKKTKTYLQMTDSDIAKQVASDAGLGVGSVDSTSEVHDYVLQDNQTNMEFLQERARRNGYRIWVADKKLYFKKEPSSSSTPTLVWGTDLLEFEARLTAASQVSEVTVRGWDPKTKEEIVGTASTPSDTPSIGYSKKGGTAVSNAFGITSTETIVDRPVASQKDAESIAQAICDEMGNNFIKAKGRCMGNPQVQAGAKIKLEGIGTRFSGEYRVTHALHTYDNNGYFTEFTVSGHKSDTLKELLKTEQEQKLGVVIGIVTNNQDPDGLCRIKVKYPSISGDVESNWARLATPMAGPGRGIEFIPEVNDEVLVAFQNNDINHPFIIGSLWNGKDEPPEKNDAIVDTNGVNKRIIKSRTGHIVTFDDTDGACKISIIDKTGKNSIEIDSENNTMTLKVDADLTLDAANGTVKIACKDFVVDASGDVKIDGTNIASKATSKFAGEGATAEIKASGSTDVKGATVKVEGSGPVTVKGAVINLN